MWGLANYSHAFCLYLWIKFYCNTAYVFKYYILINPLEGYVVVIHTFCGYSRIPVTELSSCDRDGVAQEVWNVYCLAFWRSFLTPDLVDGRMAWKEGWEERSGEAKRRERAGQCKDACWLKAQSDSWECPSLGDLGVIERKKGRKEGRGKQQQWWMENWEEEEFRHSKLPVLGCIRLSFPLLSWVLSSCLCVCVPIAFLSLLLLHWSLSGDGGWVDFTSRYLIS